VIYSTSLDSNCQAKYHQPTPLWSYQRTLYCPHPYEFRNYSGHHYEFKNYSGFRWWYCYLQLVSGVVWDITLYYNCFHHQVLAMNDPRFCIFAGFDTSKIKIKIWVILLAISPAPKTHR
jgi:hypothetical protein